MGRPDGVPAGSIIDIQNTSQLQKGDHIVIEGMGWLARSYLGVGDPAVLTVFAIHVEPARGINKVGVKNPAGQELWFDGGTKEELIAKARAKANFTRLYIVRPKAAVQAVSTPASTQASNNDASASPLFKSAKSYGLPKGFMPVPVRGWADVKMGDFVFSITPNGIERLWKVTDENPNNKSITLMLMASSQSKTEGRGEEIEHARTEPFDPSRQAVFRYGHVPRQPSSPPVAPKHAPPVPSIKSSQHVMPPILTGLLIAGGLGALAYYIWTRGGDPDDEG